jgi:hypothetical protein
MRLAIADPPYPPRVTERRDLAGGRARITVRSRSRRWYGDAIKGGHRPADFHHAAAEWDAPARHRQLLEDLVREYDGWVIATTPDGLAAYGPLPVGCEVLAWVKPNALPGGGRLRGTWEAVIAYIPYDRRPGRGVVNAHLIESHQPNGFAGSKPAAWTRWVLAVLRYDPETDIVDDLFPGSGAVQRAISELATDPAGHPAAAASGQLNSN